MSDSKRPRSKAYPRIGVEEAIELVKQIRSAIGAGPFSREAVAESMGLSPKSGYANSKTAAMVHYGFLDRSGSSYHMTGLAERVLHPTHADEEREAAIEAVKNPTLFESLFERFGGSSLPSLLANILARDFGITGNQATDVAATFRASVEFAGLLRNGILLSDSGFTKPPSPEPKTATNVLALPVGSNGGTPTPPLQTPAISSANRQFQIPLKAGKVAVLALPSQVESRDLDRIKQWIDLMEDALTDSPEE